MDIKKSEPMGCFLSTVIIIALAIIGFFYFTREFTGISAVAFMFILPALPFYYYYKKHQERKNLKIKYEIIDRIRDYAEELENLAIYIKEYNPKENEETPSEYLESIQVEITSIAERLNKYHNFLQWECEPWEWEE
jgi:hypothetical protein